MGFSSLGLDSSLLENLKRLGYHGPTPVQREAIPAALAGGDLLVSSQTGSGKTAAFALPGLQRLRTPAKTPGIGPRMLVLAPTRELAMQRAGGEAFADQCGGHLGRRALHAGEDERLLDVGLAQEPIQ